MVTAAENLVTDLARRAIHVTDYDLSSLDDHLTFYGPRIVRGTGSAPAESFDLELLDPVRQLDQPLRAGEQPRTKVCGDTEGEDVHLQVVHDASQLINLRRSQELRLVHDHVVDSAALRQLSNQVRVQVHPLVRLDRLRYEAEP